jgi:hypothetical protein
MWLPEVTIITHIYGSALLPSAVDDHVFLVAAPRVLYAAFSR